MVDNNGRNLKVKFVQGITGISWDLRLAARMLARRPGLALTAVLMLAIGIGANAAVFGLIYSVLLRPLPYPQSEALVMMSTGGDDISNRMVSYPNFADWRRRNQVFESISTVRDSDVTLSGLGVPEVLTCKVVAADYFKVLGINPLLGRDFSNDDETSASDVATVSDGFWRKTLGGDPNVIGRAISIENKPFTVIGVMADPPVANDRVPFWLLVGGNWGDFHYIREHRDENTAGFVIARLLPGITIQQARENMDAVSSHLFQEHPAENAEAYRVNVVSMKESLVGPVKPALIAVSCGAALVLLIACANIANLLLARGLARGKEMAIRAALGAGRARLLRLALFECLLLACLGGVAGLMLGDWIMGLYSSLAHWTAPVPVYTGLPAAVFTIAISV
ncbi:MAG TPA: ABC transporter permease, partial [Blastocatellia bacterium]